MSHQLESYRHFLLPQETLLFWTEAARLEPHGTANLAQARVLTYEAGMYAGKDITTMKTMTGRQGGQRLAGTLMLTDKRLLLVQLSTLITGRIILCEVIFDSVLAKNLLAVFTERNYGFIQKFYQGGLLKQMKMTYTITSNGPAMTMQVLSGVSAAKTMLGMPRVEIVVSELWLFAGDKKKDLAPQPIKMVTSTNYTMHIVHPWNIMEGAMAFVDWPWAAAMAVKHRSKTEEYNPIIDIVNAKVPAMMELINEMSRPLPPPP
ncbi:MAG: hypothetical protein NWE93_08840 [Candidatus Bathyarchaeota archaeon]|nr:hypothetical protein [Candidatus Bathyarchaeota archaeon]